MKDLIGGTLIICLLFVALALGGADPSAETGPIEGVYPAFLTNRALFVKNVNGKDAWVELENGISVAATQIPFEGGFLSVSIKHQASVWRVEIAHKGQIAILKAEGSEDTFPGEFECEFSSFRGGDPSISFR